MSTVLFNRDPPRMFRWEKNDERWSREYQIVKLIFNEYSLNIYISFRFNGHVFYHFRVNVFFWPSKSGRPSSQFLTRDLATAYRNTPEIAYGTRRDGSSGHGAKTLN